MNSVEYCHIYTDQVFGSQHEAGIAELKKYLQTDPDAHKVVLIDDYSPPPTPFDEQAFIDRLAAAGAEPDQVVYESSLVPNCSALLEQLDGGRLHRQLRRYVDKTGRYPCSLFIAAWYLARHRHHDKLVTILPESFTTPERQADEILRAAGHELDVRRIFFTYDERRYSPWAYFGTYEYVHRNYGREILPEDARIIEFVCRELASLEPRGILRAIDVGAGPNLYPSMLLTPYLSAGSRMTLADPVENNVAYLRRQLGAIGGREETIWHKFERHAHRFNPSASLDRLGELARVERSSLFELEPESHDAVLSFFVTDSITTSAQVFDEATERLTGAVRPGGWFVFAHMLGSTGYFAGEREYYPAISLQYRQLDRLYRQIGAVEGLKVEHADGVSARTGYSGMAVFVGRKRC